MRPTKTATKITKTATKTTKITKTATSNNNPPANASNNAVLFTEDVNDPVFLAIKTEINKQLGIALDALLEVGHELDDFSLLYAQRKFYSRRQGYKELEELASLAYDKILKHRKRAALLHSYVLELMDQFDVTLEEINNNNERNTVND